MSKRKHSYSDQSSLWIRRIDDVRSDAILPARNRNAVSAADKIADEIDTNEAISEERKIAAERIRNASFGITPHAIFCTLVALREAQFWLREDIEVHSPA